MTWKENQFLVSVVNFSVFPWQSYQGVRHRETIIQYPEFWGIKKGHKFTHIKQAYTMPAGTRLESVGRQGFQQYPEVGVGIVVTSDRRLGHGQHSWTQPRTWDLLLAWVLTCSTLWVSLSLLELIGAKFVWMQIVREWQLNRDADCLYGFRVSLCKMWARLVKLLNFGSGLEEKGCAWGSSMLSRIFLLLRDQNSLLFLQLLNLLGDLDVWLTDYASYCYTFFAHFEDQK